MFSTFSEFLEVVFGVAQGSVLGPLLFNIFLNDLFLFLTKTDLCNFADDNTLYACDSSLKNVLLRLQKDTKIDVEWFSNNSMVASPDKFQLMFMGDITKYLNLNNNLTYEDLYIEISETKIQPINEVKLLGVTIDNNLNFRNHIK